MSVDPKKRLIRPALSKRDKCIALISAALDGRLLPGESQDLIHLLAELPEGAELLRSMTLAENHLQLYRDLCNASSPSPDLVKAIIEAALGQTAAVGEDQADRDAAAPIGGNRPLKGDPG